jgi:hypothetical protein
LRRVRRLTAEVVAAVAADTGVVAAGRRGFGGYYDYGSCPYYTSYNWPYSCTY